ncbi:MAG: hypothetical protein LBT31_01450 [Synergistaceae bacterium]|nr:hypothetical protein [Synergistaceae bacterium]
MEMTTCNVCGKIIGMSPTSVCPSCRKLLDIVYGKARTYLRDNPKTEFRANALAKAIKEDVRLIEILVAEGKFDPNDLPRQDDDADGKRRQQLLGELQKNIKTGPEPKVEKVTYGSSKHGRSVE